MANKFNPDWDELAACKECLQEYMEEIKKLKKEWVGLTYDDMIKIWNDLYKGDDVLPTTFGMAIQAKLKEKNK